ncbi:MAG: sugar phosphate nucleotidyltransferase [Steroidobacteraceae bacterium]
MRTDTPLQLAQPSAHGSLACIMGNDRHSWVLLLAAGDGQRLAELTTTAGGLTVPKQFCTLEGGPSLLQQALGRATAAVSSERVCAVVAAYHRGWWSEQLGSLAPRNIIIQPRNRGTANGILFPLIHLFRRDPAARIVLLPSDHHVRDEGILSQAISVAAARSNSPPIVLLGLRPREPDTGLGYIVPGLPRVGGYFGVERFVEKPAARVASELILQGALWNAFIIAADVSELIKLFERRCPDTVTAMSEIVSTPAGADREKRLLDLYDALPVRDFSREILEGQEHHLSVLPVAECGWSDLGTPQRVARVLRGLEKDDAPRADCSQRASSFLSLAAQYDYSRRMMRSDQRAAGVASQ